MDANNGFNGKAFIGGNKLFDEQSYSRNYMEIPHGLVRRIVKAKDMKKHNNAETYRRESQRIWQTIAKEQSEGLPSLLRYTNATWEWTLHREFYEHFAERAAHLLDLAVSKDTSGSSKLKSIVEACAWLEIARTNDEISDSSIGLWKNLGLAYMKIVQSDEDDDVDSLPKVKDIFVNTENSFLFQSIDDSWWNQDHQTSWKGWASMRWREAWRHFLKMDGAKRDSSFEQVKAIYDTVLGKLKR